MHVIDELRQVPSSDADSIKEVLARRWSELQAVVAEVKIEDLLTKFEEGRDVRRKGSRRQKDIY